MNPNDKIQLFEDKRIRTAWDEEKEEWYFSIVDVLETYLKKGYSEEWVHQRLLAIRIRNELTDEWKKRGVQKGVEYAILTDEISRAWSGMNTRQLFENFEQLPLTASEKKDDAVDNIYSLCYSLTGMENPGIGAGSVRGSFCGGSENRPLPRR